MINENKSEGGAQPTGRGLGKSQAPLAGTGQRTLLEEANWLYEVAVRRGFKAGWIWYRLIGTYLDTPEVRIAYATQRDKLLARS